MRFVSSLVVGVAGLFLVCGGSAAADWPAGPIKYIVPYAPGGSTDILSRLIAERLRARLGQPVVVENIGGAGSAIGTARIAKSAPDGYTIGLGNTASTTVVPHLSANPLYDPLRDLTPISIVNEYVLVLFTNAKLPAKDVREFVAMSKARPAGYSYGSGGVGASNHLAALLFTHTSGGNFTHVPYKGSAPAIADVAAGHLDFSFDLVEVLMPLIRQGSIRPLATTGTKRQAMLPDVPTVSEFYPDFEVLGFMGVVGPAGMPKPIVDRLNTEIAAIMRSPEIVDRLSKQGYNPTATTPEEMAARIRKDNALWKGVISRAGIKPE